MDCSPPGSSVPGILQARILEWVTPCPTLGDLPNPGIEPRSPALQVDSLPSEPPGKAIDKEGRSFKKENLYVIYIIRYHITFPKVTEIQLPPAMFKST